MYFSHHVKQVDHKWSTVIMKCLSHIMSLLTSKQLITLSLTDKLAASIVLIPSENPVIIYLFEIMVIMPLRSI